MAINGFVKYLLLPPRVVLTTFLSLSLSLCLFLSLNVFSHSLVSPRKAANKTKGKGKKIRKQRLELLYLPHRDHQTLFPNHFNSHLFPLSLSLSLSLDPSKSRTKVRNEHIPLILRSSSTMAEPPRENHRSNSSDEISVYLDAEPSTDIATTSSSGSGIFFFLFIFSFGNRVLIKKKIV